MYNKLKKCPHCELELINFSSTSIGNHIRWCLKNEKRSGNINNFNWVDIQEAHNNGVYWNNLREIFNISKNQLNLALKNGLLTKIYHKFHHTEETKTIISKKRIFFLSENKDKHPWKNNNKFKSIPCEYFKNILKENNISFIDEFTPDRTNFSIDIAFPDKKIGIEINGNQHYNSDKTLKEYYKNRENLLKEKGWNIFQIHYSLVYKEDFIQLFINKIKNDFNLTNIDYPFYFKEKIELKLCKCGDNILSPHSNLCRKCSDFNRRKIVRPDRETLLKLVWETPISILCKDFNVSDVAIKKWCNDYNIETPPRGYWTKFNCVNKVESTGIEPDSTF
jgi:hypothetical protein